MKTQMNSGTDDRDLWREKINCALKDQVLF